jgi:hypothetical protein
MHLWSPKRLPQRQSPLKSQHWVRALDYSEASLYHHQIWEKSVEVPWEGEWWKGWRNARRLGSKRKERSENYGRRDEPRWIRTRLRITYPKTKSESSTTTLPVGPKRLPRATRLERITLRMQIPTRFPKFIDIPLMSATG